MNPAGIPPRITPENRRFYAAAGEGRLVVERCTACCQLLFPPRGVCRACGSRAVEDHEVTGPGIVYSCTVNHQPWMPGMEVPYGLALVEFPSSPGVRLLGWVDGAEVDELKVGAPVTLRFVPGPGGTPVPAFSVPASGGTP